LDFNKELNSIVMSRTDDPNKMLDELEALSALYSTLGLTVHKDTFVARALVIAPIEYASALTAEKRIKEITNKALTLDDVRSSMDTLFTTNFSDTAKAVTPNSDSNQEVRLSNFNSGRGGRDGRGRGRGRGRGKFTCFNCGKSGHAASHCRAAKSNEQRGADGRHCDYCGKNGHLEHTCWLFQTEL
jgi:hypothetical protein